MSDPRDPVPEPAGDSELVSAYLDSELDGDAAAAFEARLAAEPALAAELERTRELVETLAGLRAAPPPGFAERLEGRLVAERGTASLEAARAARPAARAVPGRAAARPRGGQPERRRAWRNWKPLPAAAAVVALAVVGGAALLGPLDRLGSPDTPVAGGEVEDAGVADSAEAPEDRVQLFADDAEEPAAPEPDEEAVDDDAPGHPTAEVDEAEPVPMAAGQPSVVDAGTTLDDENAAREHLSGSDAPAGVLGMALDPAEDVASAYRVSLQRAEPFPSTVRPDRCLDEVLAGAPEPAVPVEVEALTLDGGEALAYLVVTATDGSDRLDRVEGWVVEAEGCATRVFSDVTPGR